jgi:hypothetical protein
MYFRPDCRTTLNEVIPTEAEPSSIPPLQRVPLTFGSIPLPSYHYITDEIQENQKYLLVFQHQGTQYGHAFSDPRLFSTNGQLSWVEETSYVLYIPHNISEFTLYCHNATVSKTFYTVHTRRRFNVLASDIESRPLQTVGLPANQINFVFLSAGYKAADKEKFFADAQTVFTDIKYPSFSDQRIVNLFLKESVPFSRYAPFFNVFAVFQPSVDSGASITGGAQVNNNLMCTYPIDPTGTGLRCDMALSVALAQASAARARDYKDRTAIIVLVNHNRYGGTGLFLPDTRLAVFSNSLITPQPSKTGGTTPVGPYDRVRMTSLVSHEMGHAFTNLMDEYDIGRTEPKNIPKSNCAFSSALADLPWKHWLTPENKAAVAASIFSINSTGNGAEYAVDAIANPVCGYTNYYRAARKCMMSKLTEYYMCPVCREAATLKLMESPPAFTWPQCPLKDQLMMVPSSQSSHVYLLLNTELTQDKDFDITWSSSVPSGIALSECTSGSTSLTCRRILAPFPQGDSNIYKFTVTITHKSKWIVQSTDFTKFPWTQSTSFSVRFYDTATPPQQSRFNSTTTGTDSCSSKSQLQQIAGATSYKFRCALVPNATCSLELTAPDYVRPDTSVAIEETAQFMFYVVIGIAIVCLLLWVWAIMYYRGESRHIARPIFQTEYSGPMKIITWIMTATAVGLMLLSITLLGVGLYAYGSMGPFGQILLFCGLVLAFALYILAFTGYWAVQNRSKRILCMNGLLLLIALACSTASSLVIMSVNSDLQNAGGDWYERLDDLWRALVQGQPEYACQMELYLQCTGFEHSCDSVRANPDDCPSCPGTIGKPWSPCRKIMTDFVNDNYTTLFYSTLSVTIATVFAVLFNGALFFEVRSMKMKVATMNENRLRRHKSYGKISKDIKALVLLQSLDHRDKHNLMIEFKKIDRDKSGTLSKKELRQFLHSALCYNASPEEIDRIYKIADCDGDGQLSMAEFFGLFTLSGSGAKLDAPLMTNERQRKALQKLHQELRNNGVEDEEMSPPGQSPQAGHSVQSPQHQAKPPAAHFPGGHRPSI